jgi:hypothetical protein
MGIDDAAVDSKYEHGDNEGTEVREEQAEETEQ